MTLTRLRCEKCTYECASKPTMKKHKDKVHKHAIRTTRGDSTVKGIFKATRAKTAKNKLHVDDPMDVESVETMNKTNIQNKSIIPTVDEDFLEHKELEHILKNSQENVTITVESS